MDLLAFVTANRLSSSAAGVTKNLTLRNIWYGDKVIYVQNDPPLDKNSQVHVTIKNVSN